jgi:predicted Zn-dependent protease
MQERLAGLLAESASRGWESDLALTAEDRATLEKLGYATGGLDADPFDPTLPEARERIGDLVLAMKARELVQQGRVWMGVDPASEAALQELSPEGRQQKAAEGRRLLLEARELVAQVRAANPRDTEIDKIEGFLLLTLADFKAAVVPLERLVTTDATEIGSRFNLALCYHETGRDDWAVREMMKVVSIEPRFTKAYEWLAQHHAQRGEVARGAFWLQQHVKHAPTAEERVRIDRLLTAAMRELKRRNLDLDRPHDYPLTDRLPEGLKRNG